MQCFLGTVYDTCECLCCDLEDWTRISSEPKEGRQKKTKELRGARDSVGEEGEKHEALKMYSKGSLLLPFGYKSCPAERQKAHLNSKMGLILESKLHIFWCSPPWGMYKLNGHGVLSNRLRNMALIWWTANWCLKLLRDKRFSELLA